jgi:hypothetical protein
MKTEKEELQELKDKIAKGHLVEMILDFQNNIENPPMSPKEMYAQAASLDSPTVDYWSATWLKNIKANRDKFGPFSKKSCAPFYNYFQYKPCIVAGAGPSLKKNGHLLKDRGGIGLMSCLHNFHFFEEKDIHVDFYVTLDAGPVTVEEVYEGGIHPEDWYWERTKNKKLLAFIGSNPELLAKWQGEIYFFNSPVPSQDYMDKLKEIEEFHHYVSTGGNVLGATLYLAKGFMGANPIAYVGADFSFSYMRRFHSWDSKYDADLGLVIKMTDIFGNKVLSWQSYANFKYWFDQLALRVPGIWINCTEGGTLGSYPEGNIYAIKQMKLADFLAMYHVSKHLEAQMIDTKTEDRKILF